MNMPKIEKGIPLPPTRRYGPRAPVKTLMGRMEVGDSIVVEGVPPPPSKTNRYREKADKVMPPWSVRRWAREFNYRLYYDRVSPDSTTLRVWRTA